MCPNGMKKVGFAALVLLGGMLMGACQQPQPEQAGLSPELLDQLQDRGEAPELVNEVWLNVDEPLRLAQLEGKVVLLEFWTFG